jgi:hypothetical protein
LLALFCVQSAIAALATLRREPALTVLLLLGRPTVRTGPFERAVGDNVIWDRGDVAVPDLAFADVGTPHDIDYDRLMQHDGKVRDVAAEGEAGFASRCCPALWHNPSRSGSPLELIIGAAEKRGSRVHGLPLDGFVVYDPKEKSTTLSLCIAATLLHPQLHPVPAALRFTREGW